MASCMINAPIEAVHLSEAQIEPQSKITEMVWSAVVEKAEAIARYREHRLVDEQARKSNVP